MQHIFCCEHCSTFICGRRCQTTTLLEKIIIIYYSYQLGKCQTIFKTPSCIQFTILLFAYYFTLQPMSRVCLRQSRPPLSGCHPQAGSASCSSRLCGPVCRPRLPRISLRRLPPRSPPAHRPDESLFRRTEPLTKALMDFAVTICSSFARSVSLRFAAVFLNSFVDSQEHMFVLQ